MSFSLGLRSLAVSALALATASGGLAYSATQATTTAVPAAVASAEPAPSPSASVEPDRSSELSSRSSERVDLTAEATTRAEALAAVASQISAHDAALKAQAVAAEEAKKAATAAFLKEHGYTQGTTSPKEIARQIAANKYGWGDAQFQCYDNIIMRESLWNPLADNPTSSAYGIPQALPGKRMAEFGADWKTNPATQIKWGLNYIKQRYGTPCSGWAFKRAHGWY